MGKITVDQSDFEVSAVSLEDDSSQNSLPQQASKALNMPYMSDPTIVPRVQKYLESNIDKTYVDINQMADELQRRYREYSKRKQSAFRASVKKAYSIVLRSYGLEDKDSSENELLSSDSDQEMDSTMDSSTMNNTMMDLYTRRQNNKPTNKIDENELIDISSESEDDTRNAVNNKDDAQKNPLLPTPVPKGVFYPGNSVNDKRQHEPPSVEQRPFKKRRLEGITITQVKTSKKKPQKSNNPTGSQENVSFKDIGGMDKILEDVCKLLLHVKHPELYKKIGISPPRGFLLHGPPGCGKTLLANSIAGELGVPMIKVAAPELVAGVSGESEERIRELFERAVSQSPCILFIDEIDAIAGSRQNAQKEMERRIVAQILSCLDDLSNSENGEMVLVIGATNRADSIDPALRRAGRFDREICLGIPDVKAREQILKVLTAKLTLSDDFDYEQIAKYTPGYVGADLLSLTRESAMVAVNRVFSQIKENRKLAEALAAEKAAENRRLAEEAAAEAAAKAAAAKAEEKKQAEEEAARKKKEEEEKAAKEEEEKKAAEDSIDPGGSGEGGPICVDDELPKKDGEETAPEAPKPAETPEKAPDSSADPVVLLDDSEADTSKKDEPETEVTPEQPLVNGNGNSAKESDPEIIVDEVIEDAPQQEPMPIDPKELTALEELQAWLQDSSVISDDQLNYLCITMDDFGKALKTVQPSAKREGFATVPDTTWEDVGSLRDIREELQMAILAPVRHSEQYEALGLHIPAGVLLCGPPGCGKTLLAKAIANEAGINFISVKGPELLNMYVGESERAVRVCFERARNSAPCVIFFDELDALCPTRSDSREGGATMRVVNQMLTEMDGVEGRKGVFLLAASNRPDIIDPAVLRPGRLDKILYVGLPKREDRVDILRAITKNGTKPALDPEVDLVSIGTSEQAKGYTGADLAALVREASVLALKEYMFDPTKPLVVCNRHFGEAMEKIRPSVSEKDQKHYEKLRILYSAVSTQNQVEEMEYS